MGCYAAMPALRQAASICQADPAAVVLVVSVELCTLHVRVANDQGTILGPLLADGGEDAMAWNITNALEPLLGVDTVLAGRPHREVEHWAIHPDGRTSWTRCRRGWALPKSSWHRPQAPAGGPAPAGRGTPPTPSARSAGRA